MFVRAIQGLVALLARIAAASRSPAPAASNLENLFGFSSVHRSAGVPPIARRYFPPRRRASRWCPANCWLASLAQHPPQGIPAFRSSPGLLTPAPATRSQAAPLLPTEYLRIRQALRAWFPLAAQAWAHPHRTRPEK